MERKRQGNAGMAPGPKLSRLSGIHSGVLNKS